MTSVIILSLFGLFAMMSGLFKPNEKVILGIVAAGLLASSAYLIYEWNTEMSYFNDMLIFDNFAIAFSVVGIVITFLLFLLSGNYFDTVKNYVTERYALIIFSLIGVMVLTAYNHMVMLFVGIEIMSIPLYILAGGNKASQASNEASLKYFLMGAFATGLLLMGITLIYGETGSFFLDSIFDFISSASYEITPLLIVGMLLILAGLCFKVSLAPFHFWTPDVYQGSPTLITAFMSTVVKLGGFAGFYKLFYICFMPLNSFWVDIVAVIAALTISIGSITAVFQTSVKRILAFSSVAHAGYMVFVLMFTNDTSDNNLLFYATAYSISSLVAFTVVLAVERMSGSDEVDAFNGLAKSNPLLAFFMTIAILSLGGIPLTGGFFAKFYVLSSGLANGYAWLVIIAIVNAIISFYYYFKVVIAMYFKEVDINAESVQVSALAKLVLAICCLITVQMGIFPELLYQLF